MAVLAPLKNKEIIKKIMFLSHELGVELCVEDVIDRGHKIRKYLKDDKTAIIDLNQAFIYLMEILERKYEERYGSK